MHDSMSFDIYLELSNYIGYSAESR